MADISIFAGSVYGSAQFVAEQAEEMLAGKGFDVELFEDPEISDFAKANAVLVITSTTGQGDVPPNLELFVANLRDQFPLMNGKPFAVAALGDSSYGETYCGAGAQIHELLTELQGTAVTELLRVDACETLEPENEVLPWVESIAEKLASTAEA